MSDMRNLILKTTIEWFKQQGEYFYLECFEGATGATIDGNFDLDSLASVLDTAIGKELLNDV